MQWARAKGVWGVPGPSPYTLPQNSARKELLRKKDGCGDGSLAGVSEAAPGQWGEDLLHDWRGSSGSGVKASAVPRHEAAAATTAAARPLQRGQIRVTAAPSPCASGASRTTAPAQERDWPSSLTCASGRRSPPDVAGRGQLASVYWTADAVPQCLASSGPIGLKERRFGPERCILVVVFLPSVKAGCAVRVR